MKLSELLRLTGLNIMQNKFKTFMTSIGIIVGTATIIMVIAIGRGGQKDVAEQFKNLNAGAIDITYDWFGGSLGMLGSDMGDGGSMGLMPEIGDSDSSGALGAELQGGMTQKNIILKASDAEDLELFVPGISETTISYETRSNVDGGKLKSETSYTIAGVKENYAPVSNLKMAIGSFIEEADDENKSKICVLGASVAKEIFGDIINAYDNVLYIDGKSYVVNGVLEAMGTVASGISPDDTIFVPYETGIKYITGDAVSPTITVLAEEIAEVDSIIERIKAFLAESYPNAVFTYTDAGSKMEAANRSNGILTVLLAAMAAIVFLVGGIGIMNVLFVSIKERTGEIGILKAIGCSRKDILLEFLLEAAVISLIGGVLGIGLSIIAEPAAVYFGVRVELEAYAWGIALAFAIGTGTIFGFYPAVKASRLLPVQALSQE